MAELLGEGWVHAPAASEASTSASQV